MRKSSEFSDRLSTLELVFCSRVCTGTTRFLDASQLVETINPPVRHLLTYMLKQCTPQTVSNYTQQQLSDIQNELRRIRCLINYLLLNGVLSSVDASSSGNQNLLDIKILTHKSGPFAKKDCQQIEEIVKKSLSVGFLSGRNLLAEQTLSIVGTLKMEVGRWFVCRHDQVYSIDRVRSRPFENKLHWEWNSFRFFSLMGRVNTVNVLNASQNQLSWWEKRLNDDAVPSEWSQK